MSFAIISEDRMNSMKRFLLHGVTVILVQSLIWNIGAEYWYSTLVGLRGGYWNDDLGKVFPYTFGVSLKYSTYRFDFSYLSAGKGPSADRYDALFIVG